MLGSMRCVTGSYLLALLAWLTAPSVHAEGVEERAKVPSSTIRLRGAAGIGAIPGGYISVGGSRLQLLEGSSERWRTLHQVPGDNLYRVEADDSRILASWEQERVFHLFDRARGQFSPRGAILIKLTLPAAKVVRRCSAPLTNR